MKSTQIALFIFFVSSIIVYSQISADSLYTKARIYAQNKQFAEARTICYQIIKQSPDYLEPQVYLARIYSWNSMYDSARTIINKVLEIDSKYMEAHEVKILNETWADQYKAGISACDNALIEFPKNETILLLKAKNLKNISFYSDAVAILNAILLDNPQNSDAKNLLRSIKIEKAVNRISVSYTLDLFENNTPEPWQLLSLQYGRKTSIGSVIGRINTSNRFETTGFQYELDAYPKIAKKYYGYLNVGYSRASIFPDWRFGAEVYHSFPKSFEGSLGIRYLVFSSSNVAIYTAYAGKYIGNYWLSLRTYITPSDTKTSVSLNFQTRKYFADADNYIGFGFGYGVSPDDRKNNLTDASSLVLKSVKASLSYNKKIADFWFINTGISAAREEIFINSFRNNYTFDISIARIF